MNAKEFEEWVANKRISMGMWNVESNKKSLSPFTVGCYFDDCANKWKVYINKERGEHRVRLETKDEEQAFNKLRALVEYVIENNKGYI